jgi:hypothetical protein
MIHLLRTGNEASYFVERPWGNLLVYPMRALTPSDQDHFRSKGGVHRQLVLEPFVPDAVTKGLFDTFGAAVVCPFEMPFDAVARYEFFGIDFVDPGVEYLSEGPFVALRLLIKDKKFVFTDSRFTLVNGVLVCRDSALAAAASAFVERWKCTGLTRVFTPTFKGKNFVDLWG